MLDERQNLPPNENSRSGDQLILDLAAEVEVLCQQGAKNATEQVLDSHAEVTADDELIMSLLYAEIVSAEKSAGTITEPELITRFPKLAERISRLIAFHETFRSEANESIDLLAQPYSDMSPGRVPRNHEQLDTKVAAQKITTSVPKPVEFDRFEILEKIGQGGMGVVYRARQKDLNRIVALKVLRNPIIDADNRQRLMNEAQAVARLKHPGIVQIHQFGEAGDLPFLCFEYIDGSHLGERLARSTMAPEDACQLLQKVASAIAFAHEKGIIHRDLKPANILIDAEGEPRVADFGLAKFLDSGDHQSNSDRLTKTGTLLGTICYMAPEQFAGLRDDVDCRADIYGLGTILYEALVGRPPLIGDTPDETMYLVRTVEPTSPRKLNPKIPRDVETICLKCLEKNPDRRFQTCEQLEGELKRFLKGEPLSIRPTSSITIATRWCKRRPAIAILSALSALLLVTLSIGGYWMAWNQAQNTMLLQEQRDLARNSAELAAEKAQEAFQATQFMIRTLGSAHPERDGRNVTVAERLADGLREIKDSNQADSTGKAALLSAIGETYDGLGLLQEALEPLKLSWQLFSQLNGNESFEALKAETAYGDLLRKLGRYEEAEKHLLHARDGLNTILGSNASESIVAANCVAQNLALQGERQQSLEMFAENYQRARNSLDQLDETTVNTLLAYADALLRAGKFQQSRGLVDELLPVATDHYGPNHPLVVSLLSTSAGNDRASGNYDLALRKFQEIYDIQAERLGKDHFSTLISLNGVAVMHAEMGHYDQASELLENIQTRLAEILGDYHAQTLRSVLNVAKSLEKSDRRNEARELLKETFEKASFALGYDHPDTMMVATQYGRCLLDNNQFDEAEALLTDAMNFFTVTTAVEPVIRVDAFLDLGLLYKRTERLELAVKLHQSALEISREAFGELNPMTLSAKNNLAGSYSDNGQVDEAIDLFVEVLDGLRKMLGEDHPHTLITALNLAITYRDEDRSMEAVDILSEVVPVFNRGQLSESWLANTAQFQLGRAYLDTEQTKQAVENLEIAYAGFKKLLSEQPASETLGLANQMRTIIEQFESQDEPEIAETWRERRQFLLDMQEQPTMDR